MHEPSEYGRRLFKARVWNSGTVEFFHHIDNPDLEREVAAWRREPAPDDPAYVFYLRMKWAAGAALAETRFVEHLIVTDESSSDAFDFAATLGLDALGLDLSIFDRKADGLFACPHCQKRYDFLNRFTMHLWDAHDERGPHFLLEDNPEFLNRNQSSRRAFVKLQQRDDHS
jgi:hypothetical protein